ncbi:hypothetical protein SARC_00849 [Sphaeroforma arctica JP610]|uniref:Uncharacterized protein n=1 Tax=Sphaeroforma arctica JP610 TaxID=667725 RepID=A0A0L0GDQ2_9EUKA|nr:hypothetical protein SARC_00849 [Sphaeroforma arctica JP610]KNC87039.1 hypothetical protein SARC_00849 [Sphaeroforma arctica JP610]|eukprot:XP_014160941.1 hypothetical protein SARC_00849 [Sphaeroforma arctica JP610]
MSSSRGGCGGGLSRPPPTNTMWTGGFTNAQMESRELNEGVIQSMEDDRNNMNHAPAELGDQAREMPSIATAVNTAKKTANNKSSTTKKVPATKKAPTKKAGTKSAPRGKGLSIPVAKERTVRQQKQQGMYADDLKL